MSRLPFSSIRKVGVIMSDNACKNKVQAGKSPLEQGKKTIFDLYEEHKKLLDTLSFISSANINYNAEDYNLPNQNKFMHQAWNKTFLISKKKGKLNIKLVGNFIVSLVKECTYIFNDKSGKKPLKHYIITLQNHNGKIEKDVEITGNSKTDFKQFQTSINNQLNDFVVNMNETEFKAFVAEYISPKVASNVIIYKNAGVTPSGNLLYANALATPKGIKRADEDGYIEIGENSYIKLAEAEHYQPKLAKSLKPGKQIANALITNIIECWIDIILPLIVLGHMIMAVYYEEFIKRYGCPTLILYGETGTGKSTLVTVGLAIFGLHREALTASGATSKSLEFFSSNYNGLNVCTDDVKGETLNSSNFTALIKGAYKGIPRTRMLPYGKGVEYIHTCSPLAYSTNEALPDLQEVVNRLNIVEIFGKTFKAEKFKYHEIDKGNNDNLKELSLILPEVLKFSKEDVLKLYEQIFEMLENNVQDTQKRVINNIAYAYTGTLLLLKIAGISIDSLQDNIIEYAKQQIAKYESIKTPVEKVFDGIITLTKMGILQVGTHFKIVEDEVAGIPETHLQFHKDLILSAINKYYSYDKSKQIDERKFLAYAKNHTRFRGNNHSVRYDSDKSKVVGSMCFNISGLDDFVGISKHGIMTYQDLDNSTKGNNM